MITVMIITDSIKNNELIAASIIGGFENSLCVISASDVLECEQIIQSQKYDIDIFIIQIKMRKKGGRKLAELIRRFKMYENTPILFISTFAQNTAGYSELATYQVYKKENYISTPIQRIDVQGKIGLYLDKIIEDASAKRKHERVVFLDHTDGETFVEVRNILFAEVQDRTVTLYTKTGTYILKRTPLDNLCRVVDCECLIRCHKSFALNINAIKEIVPSGRRNWTAIFKSGVCCPISQTYYPLIRSSFIEKKTR